MNTAKKGRRKEHQIRDLFVKRGYLVTRSAASKGAFDLIALPLLCAHELFSCETCKNGPDDPKLDNTQAVLIQVKPRTISLRERTELENLRKLLPVTVRIEGWVVEDRKSPRCQFVL